MVLFAYGGDRIIGLKSCRVTLSLTRPCMIKINILLKDQVSFNRLLGGRPDLRTGY